ncbi:MAG: hypothetical protein LBU51_03185 [Bacteroidales bacterium]|jgi:hypothetical protein|nr:hypothetical protein [Bacteroidales bacterium]
MKRLLFLILFPFFLQNPDGFDKSNCTFNKQEHSEVKPIRLSGRVKVVEYGEDLRVKVVEYDNFTNCGYWRFVDNLESFRVKFVEYGEDIRIRFID